MDYADYKHLKFELRPNGVLFVTIDRPPVNAVDHRLHVELGAIWRTVDEDPKVRVVLITGAGKHFSVGGDSALMDEMVEDPTVTARSMREAADLVYNMLNLDKPIISAIHGVALGAGLATALMADITIMSETARITDGHVLAGVAAGDHAAIIWPLLCSMAKAKYYLLTADWIDGKEAERIGLVSLCVPPDQLMEKAWHVANRLAEGSQPAIRGTKRTLNNWLRSAGPTFDASLAVEMVNFLGPDAREGLAAAKAKRRPRFPSAE